MDTAERARHAQSFRSYERTDPLTKLLLRVVIDPATGCWLAPGSTKNGYPVVGEGKTGWHYGHRLVYERLVGPIPADRPRVHHQCERQLCVNPEHLEPVSAAGHAVHHGLTVGACSTCGEDDWYRRKDNGTRQCRGCRRARRARQR